MPLGRATVDKVKPQIQLTLLNEAKQEHYREFLEGLKQQATTIRLEDAEKKAVTLKLSSR